MALGSQALEADRGVDEIAQDRFAFRSVACEIGVELFGKECLTET